MENLPLTPYSNRGFNAQFLSMEQQSPLLDIRTLFRHSEEIPLGYGYSIKPRNCNTAVPGLPYSFSLNQTFASLLCLLAT